MGKKNPFVFTIGFDKSDPDHVYVTELLNTTEKKAKLIVAAILAYTGRTDETGNGYAPTNDAANHPGRSKKGIGRAGCFSDK